MKELTIEEKAKAYDEAIERARTLLNTRCVEGTNGYFHRKDIEQMFPILAESEDERIRKELIQYLKDYPNLPNGSYCRDDFFAWLEKQGNIDLEFFENGENEKREFVGYGLLKCKGDFLSFKEGETYVLEYTGKDNYSVRSDNLLGQTFHITPQQLYTVFRPTTWLEKQDNKPQGKSAQEAINEEKVDNANKIEPKDYSSIDPYFFKPVDKIGQKPVDKVAPKFKIEKGKWYVCISQFCNCIKGRAYKATSDSRIMDDFGTEYDMHSDAYKYFRLWTIQDTKDGDVLVNGSNIFIFHFIIGTRVRGYCHVNTDDGRFYNDIGNTECFGLIDDVFTPATKEQRDTLLKAMADAEYAFDFGKKELRTIDQNLARLKRLENIWSN